MQRIQNERNSELGPSNALSGAVLLMPDGTGVRNFVLGPFLSLALQRVGEHDPLHILHGIPDELVRSYGAQLGDRVQWHPLIPHRDGPVSLLLRNCLVYAHMFWANTFAMRVNRERPVAGSYKTRAVFKVGKVVGRLSASPWRIRILEQIHNFVLRRTKETEEYIALFERLRPPVLFCSHQRPPAILAPVLAARALGIPTASFIFSWDNLTSKGRIAAPFDYYLVWSEHMKQELLRYYPGFPADRIHVVGTPQFDPYADESLLWSRQEFYRRVGADPMRKLICYSGGDAGNAPQDPLHLRVLLDQIRSGKIEGQPQVVVRPSPADSGERFAALRRDYPEVIFLKPEWLHTKGADHAGIFPLQSDIQFLANLTYHSDLNINFGSTMTLDFGLHNKPVVNVAWDIEQQWPGMTLWEYQCQFEHWWPVIELGAARFARSEEEMAEHVNAFLRNPGLDAENRRKLVDLQVGAPLGSSSGRLVNVLAAIVQEQRNRGPQSAPRAESASAQ